MHLSLRAWHGKQKWIIHLLPQAAAGKLPEALLAPDLPLRLGTHRGLATQDLVLEALGKPGGYDRDVYLALVRIVDDRPEDDIGRRVCQGRHDLRDSVHLLERQVSAAGDVIYNAGGALDGALDERSRGGRLQFLR